MKAVRIALIAWILGVGVLACAGGSCYAQGPIDIGLPPAKKAQMKSFGAQVRMRAQRQRGALALARISLAQVYVDYRIDPQKMRDAETAVAKAQQELLNMHFQNQIALRRLLNAGQFGRFSVVMKDRIRHRRKNPPEEAAESFPDRLTDPATIARTSVTSDQVRRLRAMPDKKAVTDKLKKDIGQLIALYDNYNLDIDAVRKSMAVVHQDQRQMAAVTHRRQQILRSVITADQFEQLKAAIKSQMPPPHRPVRFRRLR